MAETNFTPIQLYRTATAALVPDGADLVAGELAINTEDEKLYFKNAAGTVKLLAASAAATGTVSSVSVVTANGLSDTVATATTTPAITLVVGAINLATATAYPGTSALNTVGALNAGSITSGFGAIDIGGDPLTAGATTVTSLTATGHTILGDASTDTLNVGDGGLVKDASGNVGIGTASPAVKLDVLGSSGYAIGIGSNDADYASIIWQRGDAGGSGFRHIIPSSGDYWGIQRDMFGWQTASLVITKNDGNVGIGTVSPGHKLDVYSAGNAIMRLASPNASNMIFQGGTTEYAIGNNYFSTNKLSIVTSGTQVGITLDSDGKVGIGTTSPGTTLDVVGNSRSNIHIFRSNQSAPTADAFIFRPADNSLGLGTSNTERIRIDSSGNVGIGMTPAVQFELSGAVGQKSSGTTWANPSDRRLKDNIAPADLQRCYDDVKSLPLMRYTLKLDCFTTEQARDRTVLGWVANDVQKVIPKAVDKHDFLMVKVEDGTEEVEESVRDEETGESVMRMVTKPKYRQDVIKDCLNLDTDQLMKALYGTVQLLQLRNEEQQALITALTTRLTALEAK